MKLSYKLVVIFSVLMLILVAGCTNNEKALVDAITNGNTPLAQSLLDKGVSPNLKTADGKTVLMLAAVLGHPDIAQLLIDKGADVNAKDSTGKTALMYAAEKGNLAIANLLLEKGADLNATDNDGKTALQIAQENNQSAMVEFLSNWGKPAPTATPMLQASPSPTPGETSTATSTETPAPGATTVTGATPSQSTASTQVTSANQKLTSIFFDFDKSDIRPDQVKAMNDNLAILKANPNLYIILGAHADERGSRDYNINLSARRAAVVKEYLTKADIAADHCVVYAYGKDHPLKKGLDEASRSYNRRVDILMWDTKLSGDQVLAETIK